MTCTRHCRRPLNPTRPWRETMHGCCVTTTSLGMVSNIAIMQGRDCELLYFDARLPELRRPASPGRSRVNAFRADSLFLLVIISKAALALRTRSRRRRSIIHARYICRVYYTRHARRPPLKRLLMIRPRDIIFHAATLVYKNVNFHRAPRYRPSGRRRRRGADARAGRKLREL